MVSLPGPTVPSPSDAQPVADALEAGAKAIPAIDLESARDTAEEIRSEPGTGNVLPEQRATTTTGAEVSPREKAIFSGADQDEISTSTDPGLVNFAGDVFLGRVDEAVSNSPAGTAAEATFEMPSFARDRINLPGPTTGQERDPTKAIPDTIQATAEDTTGLDLGKGLKDELGLLTGLIVVVAALVLLRPVFQLLGGLTG